MVDPGTGTGQERAGRNGVDADLLRPEFGGQIAHGTFQRRFHRPHDIVVIDNLFSAVIAHCQNAAAVRHQGDRQPRHSDQRVDRDVHRLRETLFRARADRAMQVVFRAGCDGMNNEIHLAPFAANRFENGSHLRVILHIQRQEDRGIQPGGNRCDKGF